jgi:hypothetical protein
MRRNILLQLHYKTAEADLCLGSEMWVKGKRNKKRTEAACGFSLSLLRVAL